MDKNLIEKIRIENCPSSLLAEEAANRSPAATFSSARRQPSHRHEVKPAAVGRVPAESGRTANVYRPRTALHPPSSRFPARCADLGQDLGHNARTEEGSQDMSSLGPATKPSIVIVLCHGIAAKMWSSKTCLSAFDPQNLRSVTGCGASRRV